MSRPGGNGDQPSDATLARFFALSPAPCAILDADGIIVRANRSFGAVVDTPVDALIGEAYLALVHPEDRGPDRAWMGRTSVMRHRLVCSSRTCRTVEWNLAHDPEGDLWYLVGRELGSVRMSSS